VQKFVNKDETKHRNKKGNWKIRVAFDVRFELTSSEIGHHAKWD